MGLRTAIGLMSGTSVDGVDIALIRSDGACELEFGPSGTVPYSKARRTAIRGALGKRAPAPGAEATVTEAHIEAVLQFLAEESLAPSQIDWIGFHGQTTFHDPANGITIQIGDGQALAQATGIPVVSDFRSEDVRKGGEGAPFAPLYHAALAGQLPRPLAVLNLGGVGNVTWIGPTPAKGSAGDLRVEDTPLLAFDTGPASALIDDWMLLKTGAAFDEDGGAAARGQADTNRVEAWLRHPYFSQKPPKSLDRASFEADVSDLSVEDGAATLTAFTVRSVSQAVEWMPAAPRFWIVAGGGRRNSSIMGGLAGILGVPVNPVEDVGWNGGALEAQAFAWLALRVVDGLPTSVPGTTGVPKPTTGGRMDRPV